MESHTVDLEDTLEGISLLFDDSFNIIVIPSNFSLEIDIHESPPSLDLSYFLVEFDHDYVVAHSSLEDLPHFSEAYMLSIYAPSFQLDMEWLLH